MSEATRRLLVSGLLGGLAGAALPVAFAVITFDGLEHARQAHPDGFVCGNGGIPAVVALFIGCPLFGGAGALLAMLISLYQNENYSPLAAWHWPRSAWLTVAVVWILMLSRLFHGPFS